MLGCLKSFERILLNIILFMIVIIQEWRLGEFFQFLKHGWIHFVNSGYWLILENRGLQPLDSRRCSQCLFLGFLWRRFCSYIFYSRSMHYGNLLFRILLLFFLPMFFHSLFHPLQYLFLCESRFSNFFPDSFLDLYNVHLCSLFGLPIILYLILTYLSTLAYRRCYYLARQNFFFWTKSLWSRRSKCIWWKPSNISS